MTEPPPWRPRAGARRLAAVALVFLQPVGSPRQEEAKMPQRPTRPAPTSPATADAATQETTMCDQPSRELPTLLERLSLSDETRARVTSQGIFDLESFIGLLAANPQALAALLDTEPDRIEHALATCLEEIERRDAPRAAALRELRDTHVPEYPLGALDGMPADD